MVDQWLILGHIVFSKAIEADKRKIDAIKTLSYPVSMYEIRYFLAHINFDRHFVEDFSKITHPLCKQ